MAHESPAKKKNLPSAWDILAVAQKWATKPNARAREILLTHSARDAQAAISKELNEPEYALRDAEIRDAIWEIEDQIENFARKFFAFKFTSNGEGETKVPASWLQSLAPQTVKIVGCVAVGGPGGEQGWHDFFVQEEKRVGLVCALLGNVLVEQVFGHLFFGGSVEEVGEMAEVERRERDEDGEWFSFLLSSLHGVLETTWMCVPAYRYSNVVSSSGYPWTLLHINVASTHTYYLSNTSQVSPPTPTSPPLSKKLSTTLSLHNPTPSPSPPTSIPTSTPSSAHSGRT